jgi:hypothetical protein
MRFLKGSEPSEGISSMNAKETLHEAMIPEMGSDPSDPSGEGQSEVARDRELIGQIGEACQWLGVSVERIQATAPPAVAADIGRHLDAITESLNEWFTARYPGKRPSFLYPTWRARDVREVKP